MSDGITNKPARKTARNNMNTEKTMTTTSIKDAMKSLADQLDATQTQAEREQKIAKIVETSD